MLTSLSCTKVIYVDLLQMTKSLFANCIAHGKQTEAATLWRSPHKKMDCIKSFVRIMFQAIHPCQYCSGYLARGLIYNTLMRSLITRHQRHGVPQLEPTGNVHSRPKRCGKWLSEPLNFLVANYKKSISACFKRGNVAWIGHSMNGLKTRQIHIHHYHWLMFLRMTSASKFRAVLDAGCHAIRQGDARNTPFCYLGHSSDKFKWHFLVHKKYVGTKKRGNCVVFSKIWISMALAVEETSVLACKTVHLGVEQHCATMSLFDAALFVILLIQLQKSRDWQVPKMVETCQAVSVLQEDSKPGRTWEAL